jgi:hypothetical protein
VAAIWLGRVAAAATPDAVVRVDITALGAPNPEAPGQVLYQDVEARVVEVVRGAVPSDTVRFDLLVQRLPAEIAEPEPRIGARYDVRLDLGPGRARATAPLAPAREPIR